MKTFYTPNAAQKNRNSGRASSVASYKVSEKVTVKTQNLSRQVRKNEEEEETSVFTKLSST